MRILQVHCAYRHRGGEDTVVELDRLLLESAGHEVSQLIVENPKGTSPAALKLAQAPWNIGAAKQAQRVADIFRPDIIHVHNTWFSLSPSVVSALSRLGIPIVVSIHNFRTSCINGMFLRDGEICERCLGRRLPLDGIRFRCYRGSLLESVLAAGTTAITRTQYAKSPGVSKFIVLTDFGKTKLAGAGIPEEKIVVKPNFVPPGVNRINDVSISDTYLFVGRLSAEKGPQILVEAWKSIDPKFRLTVCGDGPMRAELMKRAPRNVDFLGWCEPTQVRDLIAKSRALLLPSLWYEGFPQVLLEAFAGALPVIATNIGERDELIGNSGTTISSLDPIAWSSTLSSFETRELESWSKEAIRRWRVDFSEEAILRHLEAIYADLLGT
jgi:glycosyltransferase involved in cell wall biosynthesis